MLVTLRRKGGNLFVPKSDWHLKKLLIINQILPVSTLGKI